MTLAIFQIFAVWSAASKPTICVICLVHFQAVCVKLSRYGNSSGLWGFGSVGGQSTARHSSQMGTSSGLPTYETGPWSLMQPCEWFQYLLLSSCVIAAYLIQ